MTEKEKDLLAIACGYTNERYADKVKQAIDNELGLDREAEIAIIRKLCAKLLYDVSEIKKVVLGSEVSNEDVTDFIIYNANVEQKKSNAKIELT